MEGIVTVHKIGPQLNVQSVVGNPTLLLWSRRRGVAPSVRSIEALMLLLSHYFSAVLWLCVCVLVCTCVSYDKLETELGLELELEWELGSESNVDESLALSKRSPLVSGFRNHMICIS